MRSIQSIVFGLLIAVVISANAEAPFLGTIRDCPANETYFKCGENCQTECATLGDPCYISYFRCPDGCYCNPGYARHPETTSCILQNECPAKMSRTKRFGLG